MGPAATLTSQYLCPMVTPVGPVPTPHVGGSIMVGTPTVIVGGMPIATLTSTGMCAVPPPCVMAVGSATVLVGAIPAMAMAKQTAHGGMIVQGQPTVIIGG